MTIQALRKSFLPVIAPEDFLLLVAQATGRDKVFLLAHPEHDLTEEEERLATRYLKRRQAHEPVAAIIGHKEFYGRDFLVTRATLIPRPETELLVEKALTHIMDHLKSEKKIDIIDIGTGSGAIIITLRKEISETFSRKLNIRYFALDISLQALNIAQKNATRHDVTEKIVFLTSDLLTEFSLPIEKDRHTIIVANLPYLSTDIYEASAPDVRLYEPTSALVSGKDGLAHYRRLFSQLETVTPRFLSTTLFLEMSPEQSPSLSHEVQTHWPRAQVSVFHDLSGKDRLIQAIL